MGVVKLVSGNVAWLNLDRGESRSLLKWVKSLVPLRMEPTILPETIPSRVIGGGLKMLSIDLLGVLNSAIEDLCLLCLNLPRHLLCSQLLLILKHHLVSDTESQVYFLYVW